MLAQHANLLVVNNGAANGTQTSTRVSDCGIFCPLYSFNTLATNSSTYGARSSACSFAVSSASHTMYCQDAEAMKLQSNTACRGSSMIFAIMLYMRQVQHTIFLNAG